jgi:hypothetical protein
MLTEADTCRKFVVPLLQKAGWDDSPHMINEQRTFTDRRAIFVGGKARRGKQKRADYILRYTADYPLADTEDVRTRWLVKILKKIRAALDEPECEGLLDNIRKLRERFEPEALAKEDAVRARRARAASRAYKARGGAALSQWLPPS